LKIFSPSQKNDENLNLRRSHTRWEHALDLCSSWEIQDTTQLPVTLLFLLPLVRSQFFAPKLSLVTSPSHRVFHSPNQVPTPPLDSRNSKIARMRDLIRLKRGAKAGDIEHIATTNAKKQANTRLKCALAMARPNTSPDPKGRAKQRKEDSVLPVDMRRSCHASR
jgi:hypothetical protein